MSLTICSVLSVQNRPFKIIQTIEKQQILTSVVLITNNLINRSSNLLLINLLIIDAVASYPIDICYQSSLFRRVDPLVIGPHTTLDGEQQNLEVTLLLEPERKQTQGTQKL